MVGLFEMPFEFDNVPLASLQIISPRPHHRSPLALYDHKYQDARCCIQATALRGQIDAKRVSVHSNWQLDKWREDAIHSKVNIAFMTCYVHSVAFAPVESKDIAVWC